jgi:hypothetical protein
MAAPRRGPAPTVAPVDIDAPRLTTEQAYEAAYRFVSQYLAREPGSTSLMLMLVSMRPTPDRYRTNDPAS